MVEEHQNSDKNPYLYNGKELDEESGLYYYGARYYDAEVGRWWSVDPAYDLYYSWSPYNYVRNNPVNLTDPNGMWASTDVVQNEDGSYTVVGGDENDNDNGIYVVKQNEDGGYDRTGKTIGYSATPESFFNSESGEWMGNINPNDKSGSNFLNLMLSANPDLLHYTLSATGGKHYDFKRTNGTGKVLFNTPNEYYRGMPLALDGDNPNLPVYGSARDVGNIAAGLVAARNGVPWGDARIFGFDALESYQQGRLAKETSSTQYGEKLGYRIGCDIVKKTELSKLPSYGELRSMTISKKNFKKSEW